MVSRVILRISHLRRCESSESKARYCGGLRRENAEVISEYAKDTSRWRRARAARGYNERRVGAVVLLGVTSVGEASMGADLVFGGEMGVGGASWVMVVVDIVRRDGDNDEQEPKQDRIQRDDRRGQPAASCHSCEIPGSAVSGAGGSHGLYVSAKFRELLSRAPSTKRK